MAAGGLGGLGAESSRTDYANAWHGDYHALSAKDRPQAEAIIGSPGIITSRAMLASVPAWARWRDQILTAVVGSHDEDTLAGHLDAWAKQATSDDALEKSEIAGSIYEATLHADMAGQLFVRQIEVPEASERANAADGEVRDPFAALDFDAALAYFLERRVVTPEQFRRLSDQARMRSFTATRMASDTLIQRCRDLLAQSIREGGTYEEFRAAMLAGTDSSALGITPDQPGYLETVYRTNVVGAYGAGRYRQLTSDAVRSARPYLEYRTAGDNRVRPTHAELAFTVFAQDDDGWHEYAPPNGFQCRCVLIARRADQIDRARVVRAADLNVRPDEGFRAAPTVEIE